MLTYMTAEDVLPCTHYTEGHICDPEFSTPISVKGGFHSQDWGHAMLK
jgi:hypothetical protein